MASNDRRYIDDYIIEIKEEDIEVADNSIEANNLLEARKVTRNLKDTSDITERERGTSLLGKRPVRNSKRITCFQESEYPNYSDSESDDVYYVLKSTKKLRGLRKVVMLEKVDSGKEDSGQWKRTTHGITVGTNTSSSSEASTLPSVPEPVCENIPDVTEVLHDPNTVHAETAPSNTSLFASAEIQGRCASRGTCSVDSYATSTGYHQNSIDRTHFEPSKRANHGITVGKNTSSSTEINYSLSSSAASAVPSVPEPVCKSTPEVIEVLCDSDTFHAETAPSKTSLVASADIQGRCASRNSCSVDSYASSTGDHHDNVDRTPFEKQVLSYLATIQQQNSQILNWMSNFDKEKRAGSQRTPIADTPVELPMKTIGDLEAFEEFLQDDKCFSEVCTYMSSFGGSGTTLVNTIMRHFLTNELAMQFSFRGKKGKNKFCVLALKIAIVRSARKCDPMLSERDVEDCIKVWLKHAPSRFAHSLLKSKNT